MNERIEKLMLNATKDIPQGYYIPPQYFEKFAELIVRECIAICQDIDGEDNIDARSGRQDCAVEIREHFGVEDTMKIAIHTFDSTGDAYDACQCDESIRNGDTLLIPSERVVGLADTWPIAVTREHGALYSLKHGSSWSDWLSTLDNGRLLVAVAHAQQVAAQHGYGI